MHPYPQARRQAQQLAATGDLPGARAVLERAVDAGRPGLAAGDPELLATMRQLAALHTQEGDPAGARRLLEEAYAAGQRRGPADQLMVLLAYDLAVVAEELANRHEARRNFTLIAEHGPAALGESHPAVTHARAYAADSSPTTALPVLPAPVPNPPSAAPPAAAPPTAAPPTAAQPTVTPPTAAQPTVTPPAAAQHTVAFPAAQPSGVPVSGSPISATPVYGAPVSGTPMSASPFGAAARKPSRTPWVIAAAALVFAVVMLVVVLVRPSSEPTSGTPVAASVPAVAPPASATTSATPATTRPTTTAPAGSKPTRAAPKTTAPRPTVATRIVTPKNGSGVERNFTVTFTVSAADVAATDTRLALTVCVKIWCFLDGPVVIEDGKAEDYTVTLGTGEGEGVGEKWTVRVDRLSESTYDFLMDHKQTAVDDGTWGDGVTTPTDRLNKKPVNSVVVTKTA